MRIGMGCLSSGEKLTYRPAVSSYQLDPLRRSSVWSSGCEGWESRKSLTGCMVCDHHWKDSRRWVRRPNSKPGPKKRE